MTDEDVRNVVSSASNAQRETLLRKAFEGEIIGEAMYDRLAVLADNDHRRETARLAAEVERTTADALLPLMTRHGIPFDRHRAWNVGIRYTDESIDKGWHGYFADVLPLAEQALTGMKRLHALSDEQDQIATGRLVAHEEALLEFVRRELEGVPDSTAPLREYLDHDADE